jgi:hypothetical protein
MRCCSYVSCFLIHFILDVNEFQAEVSGGKTAHRAFPTLRTQRQTQLANRKRQAQQPRLNCYFSISTIVHTQHKTAIHRSGHKNNNINMGDYTGRKGINVSDPVSLFHLFLFCLYCVITNERISSNLSISFLRISLELSPIDNQLSIINYQ